MLKEKQNSFVVVKLSNNDEVLCKLKDDGTSEDVLNIEKPRSLIRTPDGPGLAPYIQLGDESKGVEINKSHIISILPMHNDVKADYIQATTGVTILKNTDIN